jgi:hypothetical protein
MIEKFITVFLIGIIVSLVIEIGLNYKSLSVV